MRRNRLTDSRSGCKGQLDAPAGFRYTRQVMANLEISAEELQGKLTQGAAVYLLDVRADWEHQLARIGEGPLVPLQQILQRLSEIKPPQGAELVCYCHHGTRSLQAASFLRQAGFPQARSLAGGIDRWSLAIDPSVPRY
jgi:rhodanese-related sulfurtransferase